MRFRAVRALNLLVAGGALALAGGALSGCKQDAPVPAETAAAGTVSPQASPSTASSGSADGVAAGQDMDALHEKQDPERLLRYYANSVRVGDWASAAKAWSLDALMTPQKLEAEFGGDAGPKIAIGKGDAGGAAGSLYYEAPVVIDFPDGRPSRRGTIVLRRANDVPGASAEQLVWRIERSSTVPQ